MLAIAAPLATVAARARRRDMAIGRRAGRAARLFGFFRFARGARRTLLPVAALACVIGGGALGAFGWLGSTTLLVSLPGAERVYPVRGRDTLLLDLRRSAQRAPDAC